MWCWGKRKQEIKNYSWDDDGERKKARKKNIAMAKMLTARWESKKKRCRELYLWWWYEEKKVMQI